MILQVALTFLLVLLTAVMVAFPAFFAVTFPLLFTVATFLSEEDHFVFPFPLNFSFSVKPQVNSDFFTFKEIPFTFTLHLETVSPF